MCRLTASARNINNSYDNCSTYARMSDGVLLAQSITLAMTLSTCRLRRLHANGSSAAVHGRHWLVSCACTMVQLDDCFPGALCCDVSTHQDFQVIAAN